MRYRRRPQVISVAVPQRNASMKAWQALAAAVLAGMVALAIAAIFH
jgi:hypothetical protein